MASTSSASASPSASRAPAPVAEVVMTRDEAVALLAAPNAGTKLARRVRALLAEGRGARRCRSCGDRFTPPSRRLRGWTPRRCALCSLARQIAGALDRSERSRSIA